MPALDSKWSWGIASAVLIAVTFLSTVLATVIVDTLLIRPVPASVNTLLPGWTYAAVTILKVCLVTGVVAGIVFVFKQARPRWFPGLRTAVRAGGAGTDTGNASHTNASKTITPGLAILSILLPSVAPLIGAVGVVVTQALIHALSDVTMSAVEQMSRSGVVVMAVCLVAGFGVGGLAVHKREPERHLAMVGVATNACLIALFWYWKFYAAGFDQDRWAPQ